MIRRMKTRPTASPQECSAFALCKLEGASWARNQKLQRRWNRHWRSAESCSIVIAILSIFAKSFSHASTTRVKAMKIKKQLTNKNRQGGARDEHHDRKIVSICWANEVCGRNDAKNVNDDEVFGYQPVHDEFHRKSLKNLERKNYHSIEFHSRWTRKKRKNAKWNHHCRCWITLTNLCAFIFAVFAASSIDYVVIKSVIFDAFQFEFVDLNPRAIPRKFSTFERFRVSLNARWFILHRVMGIICNRVQ